MSNTEPATEASKESSENLGAVMSVWNRAVPVSRPKTISSGTARNTYN